MAFAETELSSLPVMLRASLRSLPARLLMLAMVMQVSAVAFAQPPLPGQPLGQPLGQPMTAGPSAGGRPFGLSHDTPSPQVSQKLQSRFEEERQRRLIQASHRLVLLTLDLKQQIAATGSSTLTPEMRRRSDEIERLARSIHQQMLN